MLRTFQVGQAEENCSEHKMNSPDKLPDIALYSHH